VTTVAELSIPAGWDGITPAWMTAALAGHHPGAVVDDVRVALRDDGTNKRARLELTYSAGSGPATVFAKAVDPAHAELVALTSGLYHEPRLFSSGVPLPLDHPTVYAALIDEERSDFLMIMEDVVSRGADPRDSTRPMTVGQVACGVRGLARLHSAYWGARLTGNAALGWVEPFVAFEGMQYAPLHIAHERLGDTVAAEILALSGEQLFIDIWARYIGTLTTSPQTLLHGDPHIGNTYVLPDDDVGFLDWQMVRRGNWSLDLGYFLQGALTIEDRRRSERDLLEEYRAALTLPADETPSADEVLLRYRASVAHGLAIWMATLSGGDAWQSPQICLALAQRYAAAFIDLDTRAAIDAID
jgi:aminoglycoside phosphotransferase (APT) family kinase protein